MNRTLLTNQRNKYLDKKVKKKNWYAIDFMKSFTGDLL